MPRKKLVLGFAEAAFACSEFGVELKTGGSMTAGVEDRASASTAGAETVTTTAANANEEAPARKHIRNGVFQLILRDFLRITILGFY
jgi:hypothetical protein